MSCLLAILIRSLKPLFLHLNDESLSHRSSLPSISVQTVTDRFSSDITVKLKRNGGDPEREQTEDDTDADTVNRGVGVPATVENFSRMGEQGIWTL